MLFPPSVLIDAQMSALTRICYINSYFFKSWFTTIYSNRAGIDGETNFNIFGRSISISADGFIFVVGGSLNDGSGMNAGMFVSTNSMLWLLIIQRSMVQIQAIVVLTNVVQPSMDTHNMDHILKGKRQTINLVRRRASPPIVQHLWMGWY